MDKKIGIILIVVAAIILAIALLNYTRSQNLITEYSNQTGSCFIDGTCLHEQTNIIFVLMVISAAAIAVIGALILIFKGKAHDVFMKPEANVQANANETKPLKLSGEQKKIYDIVVESGSLLQSELVEKSGMNKVRVSRILDKLEMRGLIERRRHGMSNIVLAKKA